MTDVIQVNDESFGGEVFESTLPTLVDFWAPWCGPCKMVGVIVEGLAKRYAGRLKVAKLDIDSSGQVASLLGIRSVPTVALFDKNQVVDVIIGARPEQAYVKLIDAYLKKMDKKRKKEAKRRGEANDASAA